MNLMDTLTTLTSLIIIILGVLMGVAFLTLLERKTLSYIQTRKGPNKVSLMGLLQPFSDAIKLFSKEQTNPKMSNYLPYYTAPILALLISLVVWTIHPVNLTIVSFPLSVLFFLACMSLGVYTVMTAGWASNSNYALLGSLRAVAQTISYEVSLALILMFTLFLTKSVNLTEYTKMQEYSWFIWLSFPIGMSWLASTMAETNRTPFDFAEGESELVSGFNIEYSSGGFALIFLAEYASILFMSMLFTALFMGGIKLNIYSAITVTAISFVFIWVRGTLPRLRYDKLMNLTWKFFLPMALYLMILSMSLAMFTL
uniref:NADH-ubiquinone oxidoreductase chain 1 n=1 Tax=Challia fletcheri TaxID=1091408 RepID=J7EUM6_9NEOP|nr:NADH dehydrogenase subunit 1 [Challia fletcheri]AEP83060.1 NADH dehydrogenase subunit 1 [Challia fletcheri]